jgi:uncharacterized membrane protein YphA (DoxX/SURF4 family)
MEHDISIGLGRWHARPIEWKLQWVLRLAVSLEFIGHGLFGIIGKEGWLAYYAVLGIPADVGWTMMPVTGAVDITLGVLVLLRPTRALIAYMAFWGLFTATLRPLAGEGIWELVERSYNYGVPAALLLLYGIGHNGREWLGRVRAMPRLTRSRAQAFFRGFQWIIGLYLIGHGSLGLLTQKPGLIALYDSIGLTSLVSDPGSLNTFIGAFEIGLGLVVLIVPATSVLLFVLAWKLGTEFLFVTSGAYGAPLEVIGRASCYAAPIAAILCRQIVRREEEASASRRRVGIAPDAAAPT